MKRQQQLLHAVRFSDADGEAVRPEF